MDEEEGEATVFSTRLVETVQDCCRLERPVTYHTLKEQMWEKYYKLHVCSSDNFRSFWTDFLQYSIGFHPGPIFFLFITDVNMNNIIKDQFPVKSSTDSPSIAAANLDFEEVNALLVM